MAAKKIVAAAVVLAIGAGAALWWSRGAQRSGAAGELLTLHGNVDIRQVSLAFNGSERIVAMHAEEGQRVARGELLAELDTTRQQHTVAQLAAQVEAQRQNLARLAAGSRPEEIAKAKADAEAAKAEARNAERTAERLHELVLKKLTAPEQADAARSAAEASAARARAVQEALALVLAGPRREDVEAARATLRATEAQLALAEKQLADLKLYAPDRGVIENRLLQPGDLASPQTPVYTLALERPLWVRTYVGGPDLGRVRPGMAATVRSDSFPGKGYRGWVGFISPTAEFTPKSVETREVRTSLVYQVRVMVCDPQGELRLGMPVVAELAPGPGSDGGEAATTRCPE